MLIHGKFSSIPDKKYTTPKPNEQKAQTKTPPQNTISDVDQVAENEKIKKELKETKDLLNLILDKVSTPQTIVVSGQAEGAGETIQSSTDIFNEIESTPTIDTDLTTKISTEDIKLDKNVDDDLDALSDLLG